MSQIFLMDINTDLRFLSWVRPAPKPGHNLFDNVHIKDHFPGTMVGAATEPGWGGRWSLFRCTSTSISSTYLGRSVCQSVGRSVIVWNYMSPLASMISLVTRPTRVSMGQDPQTPSRQLPDTLLIPTRLPGGVSPQTPSRHTHTHTRQPPRHQQQWLLHQKNGSPQCFDNVLF